MRYAAIAWGDFPSWLAAVGTLLAFFATFWLLLLTRREQRAVRFEERKGQARAVSVWAMTIEISPDSPLPPSGGVAVRVQVTLRNRSDEPIYSVRLAVAGESGWVSNMPWKGIYEDIVPPNSERDYVVEMKGPRIHKADGKPSAWSSPVEIVFTDAGGVSWLRNMWGVIQEISSNTDKQFFMGVPTWIRERQRHSRFRRAKRLIGRDSADFSATEEFNMRHGVKLYETEDEQLAAWQWEKEHY